MPVVVGPGLGNRIREKPFDTIGEGVNQAICNFVYAGADDAEGGDSIRIDVTGSLGDPPVRLVVSIEGVSHIPVPESGTVAVTEVLVVTHSFLRGDVNSTGSVDLADGIRLLNVLFNEAPIACAETADINADGTLQLNDGILLLNFLFNEGSPPSGGGDCESVEEELCAEDTPSCD